jgi:hypothetical protein
LQMRATWVWPLGRNPVFFRFSLSIIAPDNAKLHHDVMVK